ncbi:DUF4142 domain-containing protein [Niabella aurantiaca]|uniref:DUF4142 domain-containing protein n=1 Tax=Niabella aurantiaca TaxID=379900 RepID=UPI000A070CCB|nr:DUF4142 domain-containing protein [Niabella aurantiaca]
MIRYCLGMRFRMILLLGMIAAACNTAPDSERAAGDSNKLKFNRSDSANPSLATFERDADFAVTAADGGLLEVQLGQLAQQNGRSEDVKEFGLMMIKDHSAANNELRVLAEQKSISLPDSLSESMKRKYTALQTLKGADFDKEYMSLMVEDHEEDVEVFRKYAGNGADQRLAQWAEGKLPVLQRHLQHARHTDSLLKR